MPKRRKIIEIRIDKLLPVTASQKRYWEALGRFVDIFSIAEIALNLAVIKYARLNVQMAKALVLPLRVDEGCEKLKRVIVARKLRGSA